MELIKEWWGLFAAIISWIVGVTMWLMKLQARTEAAHTGLAQLWRQRHEDLEATRESRSETSQKLDQIENKIDKAFSELRLEFREFMKGRG